MPSDKREQAPLPPELQEVRLVEVEEHDILALETESGSIYNLTVIEPRHGSPVVVLDRQSEHPMRSGEHAIDLQDLLRFSLLGSCQGVLSAAGGEELIPVGPIEKMIMLGKRVRMQSEAGGDPIVTTPVTSIRWIKGDGSAATE